MHADRIDCCPAALAIETQRIVLMVLLSSDPGPWSRADLDREIKGSRGEPIDVDEAIDALYGAGLIHVSDNLVLPTRAARVMDELRL
jgi:hypothetical protein